MIHEQEIVATNIEDDSSMFQVWTVAQINTVHFEIYNVEANRVLAAPSPKLAIKPHIGKPNQKIDLAETTLKKPKQDIVFRTKTHLVSCMATQMLVPEQEVQKHLPFTSDGRSGKQGIAA